MKRLSIIMATTALLLSGCISLKSYVDTGYSNYDYDLLTKPANPVPIRLATEFSTNGKSKSSVTKHIEKILVADFEESGQFVVVEDETAPLLTFSLNNVANTKDAAGKGFVTGLTFGASGSTVSDGYEAKISFDDGTKKIERDYKHGIVSTVGNEAAPLGATVALKPAEAVEEVIEDIMARFISEMGSENNLVSNYVIQNYLP